MLANISDTVSTLHVMKSACQPLDAIFHSGHHTHANVPDYAHCAHYNHHLVICIPAPPYEPPAQPTI